MLDSYPYSSDFQDELLVTMIRYPELFIGMSEIIDYGYFTGVNSQLACKLMQTFYKKHGNYPTFTQLANQIQAASRKDGDDRAVEAVAYVQKLSEIEVRTKEFYRDEAVGFARQRALILAATDVAKTIQEGKEPGSDIVKKFQDALSVGQNLLNKGYLLKQDYLKIIDKLTEKDYGTFTGYDLFDTVLWKRGWGPGWLVVPLAPPKRYKSMFCLNLAVNMATKMGYDVIYYACEINEELAALRLFQNLTGASVDELYDDPDRFKRKVHSQLVAKFGQGNILIKHYPAKSASISDIRAHAISSIQAFNLKPKAIFIDYAETVNSTSSGDKNVPAHRQVADVYTEARALGSELGCCVVMPDRCNREAVDQATPSMDSFQGAFEKAGIVDIAIGLCGTAEEYDRGDVRYFVVLNRHGEGGTHIRGKVDRKKMRMSVDAELSSYETREVEEQVKVERDNKTGRHHKASTPQKSMENLGQDDQGFDSDQVKAKIRNKSFKPPH